MLSHTCSLPDSLLSSENPAVIALRSEFYVQPKSPCLSLTFVTRDHEEGDDLEVLRERCKELSTPVLDHARDQLGLYVHPVVRGDLRALTSKRLSVEGHRAEAELRNVYVLFISPKISAQVTGNPIEDAKAARIRFESVVKPTLENLGFKKISGRGYNMINSKTNQIVMIISAPSNFEIIK